MSVRFRGAGRRASCCCSLGWWWSSWSTCGLDAARHDGAKRRAAPPPLSWRESPSDERHPRLRCSDLSRTRWGLRRCRHYRASSPWWYSQCLTSLREPRVEKGLTNARQGFGRHRIFDTPTDTILSFLPTQRRGAHTRRSSSRRNSHKIEQGGMDEGTLVLMQV
jgi:hypothetical protein